MKTFKNHKLVLAAAVLLMMAACAYSYPPDNAAVLYYKAAAIYEVDDEMADMLADLQKDNIELNDKIRKFLKKKHLIIDTILDASEIKNCDWGMDFSQGMEMDMPPLGSMRKLTYLIMADTKILAEDKDYETALGHCMSLYKMARHINDRIFISNLVAISINTITNDRVIQIVADMPQDTQSLTKLKNELTEIDSIPFSIKPAIFGEREAMLNFMTPEHMTSVAHYVEDKSVKEKILSADEAFLKRNREYFKNFYAGIIAAFDMPYVEGYDALEKLHKKMTEDTKSNPDAILAGILAPASQKMFSQSIRFQTHNNAIKTAVELYLIKAKTGKLPDELPAGLPKDLFSDKDFEYEKTDDGFVLRCQGKDLGKDEAYEYEFKVKK